MTKEEKLNYLLEHYMSATEVTKAFGFKSNTMISNMRKGQTNIATLHMEGLEKHFHIPVEIFEHFITTKHEINKCIKDYRKQLQQPTRSVEMLPYHQFSKKVFPMNDKFFQKLKGIWYGYVYPSNPASSKDGVYEVKTIIAKDYSVIDQPWGNKGFLQIGKNESLIIKESYEHNDLTIIRFSNRQVHSGLFRFVSISNQNHTLHELVNFGFFSRKQYSANEAKEILGTKENKQLKLDLDFNERLIERAIVPQ
jgi:hypothetical protein